jgi:hypothetical protein
MSIEHTEKNLLADPGVILLILRAFIFLPDACFRAVL